jgi:hypothetical protein
MTLLIQAIIWVVAVCIILWGGDRLLSLFPGYEKIKSGIRTVVAVVMALWCLSLIAELVGVSMPWGPGPVLHRHR